MTCQRCEDAARVCEANKQPIECRADRIKHDICNIVRDECAAYIRTNCRHSDPDAETVREAVSFADLEAAAAHIEQNGSNLRVKFGDEYEGRCRELCAMYLREFIVSQRMQTKLDKLNHALDLSKLSGRAR